MNLGEFRRSYYETLIHGGILNLFRSVYYRSKTVDLQIKPETNIGNTSITDSILFRNYPETCTYIANSDSFNYFRRIKTIINVYDHVTFFQATQYIRILAQRNHLNFLGNAPALGKPFLYKFKGVQNKISTLETRYSKIFSDIKILFPDIRFKNVCEIGVGFGGLAHMFNDVESYTLYDLPEVNELAKLYLKKSNVPNIYKFQDGRKPFDNSKFDLVISNYAFSELTREMQDLYLQNILLNSVHGYITWSPVSYFSADGYPVADLLRIISNAQVMDERPLTGARNLIIYW
jgi:putative sugar O-methyltransferase